MKRTTLLLLVASVLPAGDTPARGDAPSAASPAADARLAWPGSDSSTRPWAYWWWLGSAVDRENLSRELKRYREAGMGGCHIVPIYGAKGYEDRSIEYLSPQWMEMLGHLS